MKRTAVALSLLALALSGCSSQSGDANTDSQVVQPPDASSTTQRTQGPDPAQGPGSEGSAPGVATPQ